VELEPCFCFAIGIYFLAISSSYKVNEHPFVCHTQILGRVVIPSGTTGFFQKKFLSVILFSAYISIELPRTYMFENLKWGITHFTLT
jgi:hypothetical protein